MNWKETYKGGQKDFSVLRGKLKEIYPGDFPQYGTYPSDLEKGIGLTLRRTGAGAILARDLETSLEVKASTWEQALRSLRGNCGAANKIWGERVFGDNLPLDPRQS